MKKTHLILLILLVLGGFLNYLPHLNYSYPLHVDEWTHFTYAKHLSDSTPLYFGGESTSLEHGFHLLLAVLKNLGLDYSFQFQFLPSLLTILISLSLFILVRKHFSERIALFSVLFFIFVRSSLEFLGPMFLVPLSIGLLLIPIGLFLVETNLLFFVIAAALIIHPPSGIALLFLVGSYLLFNLKSKIVYNILLGVLLSLPIFFGNLAEKGLSNLQFRESIIPVIFLPRSLGLLIMVFVFFGIYLLAVRKKYFFILYTIIFYVLTTLYYQFDINILIFYERNIMYLLQIFSIPFALSLDYLYKYKKVFVLLLFILLFLFIPVKIESTSLVYHIVDDSEYKEFSSYKNVEGTRAVLDPWKAIAFTPLAEKEVYSRIPPGPNPIYLDRNVEIYNFFNQSCVNKTFLETNKIDLVVGC